jgi:hypothetical protein
VLDNYVVGRRVFHLIVGLRAAVHVYLVEHNAKPKTFV